MVVIALRKFLICCSFGAPGSVAGVFQVNVQVPSGITVGSAVPVMITLGTSNTQNGVTIAVSN